MNKGLRCYVNKWKPQPKKSDSMPALSIVQSESCEHGSPCREASQEDTI